MPQATGFPFQREDPGTELRLAPDFGSYGGKEWTKTTTLNKATPIPLAVGANHRVKPARIKNKYTSPSEVYMKLKDPVDDKGDNPWPDSGAPAVACMCVNRFQLLTFATVGKTRNNSHCDCTYELHVAPPAELCKNHCFQRKSNTDFVIVFSLPDLKKECQFNGVFQAIRPSV